jgi:hypothetical protein
MSLATNKYYHKNRKAVLNIFNVGLFAIRLHGGMLDLFYTNKGFDMTEKQALALINRRVMQAGGKKAASYAIGIDHSHLCSVLKGTRGIPRYLAVWAGLVEKKAIVRTYEVAL